MAETTNVVVTGGTGALGAGVVELFLSRGATVHLPMMEAELPAHAPWRNHERVKAAPGMSLDNEAQVTQFYASLLLERTTVGDALKRAPGLAWLLE